MRGSEVWPLEESDEVRLEKAVSTALSHSSEESWKLSVQYKDYLINPQASTLRSVSNLAHFVPFGSCDTVIDLGAGYGEFAIYGGLLSSARFIGIEIVESRVAAATSCAQSLELDRVKFEAGDFLSMDLDIGDIFYSYNSLLPRSYPSFVKFAQRLALGRKRTLVLSSPMALAIRDCQFVKCVRRFSPNSIGSTLPLYIFETL